MEYTTKKEFIVALGKPKVTGQDIQQAYNDVLWPQELRDEYAQAGIPLSLQTWEDTDDKTKQLYNQLAEKLNTIVENAERQV